MASSVTQHLFSESGYLIFIRSLQIQLDKLANKPQGSSYLHPQYWDYKHDSPCPALFCLRQLSFCVTLAVLELAM